MSGILGGSKKPKLPAQQTIEEVDTIKEDETAAGRREKRKTILSAQTGGKQSTILSGIATALKKRLGE